MPLEPSHILSFLGENINNKVNSELIDLLIKIINKLCFEECQIDRIQCTLTPLCTKRFLLKLRIKNGLTLEDLPKFCYSVLKNIFFRYFWGKTIVYRPLDTYLYLVDFLDVIFHGDYRKLNKFIGFKNWEEVLKIFDDRIYNRNENFKYYLTDNYLIFNFDEHVHVIYFEENYVLCNATRENIHSLELLYALCKFYAQLYFPDFSVKLNQSDFVVITSVLPRDVIHKVSNTSIVPENPSKSDDYFWNVFSNDLDAITQFCREIHLKIDEWNGNLEVKLWIDLKTQNYDEYQKHFPLTFKDLLSILKYVKFWYKEFYIYWL